jgi:hypothetical protein
MSTEGKQTGDEKSSCEQAREMMADSHAVLLARLAWANGTDAASQYSAQLAGDATPAMDLAEIYAGLGQRDARFGAPGAG